MNHLCFIRRKSISGRNDIITKALSLSYWGPLIEGPFLDHLAKHPVWETKNGLHFCISVLKNASSCSNAPSACTKIFRSLRLPTTFIISPCSFSLCRQTIQQAGRSITILDPFIKSWKCLPQEAYCKHYTVRMHMHQEELGYGSKRLFTHTLHPTRSLALSVHC